MLMSDLQHVEFVFKIIHSVTYISQTGVFVSFVLTVTMTMMLLQSNSPPTSFLLLRKLVARYVDDEQARRDNVVCNVLCVVKDYNLCCNCCSKPSCSKVSYNTSLTLLLKLDSSLRRCGLDAPLSATWVSCKPTSVLGQLSLLPSAGREISCSLLSVDFRSKAYCGWLEMPKTKRQNHNHKYCYGC